MLSTFTQYNEWGFLILRLAVLVIFVYHGWPKLSKPAGMAGAMGWPTGVVRGLGALEILSGLGLLFAGTAQSASLILALVMAGAIYTKITKWHIPFFSQSNTGWEFDFILLAANLFLLTNTG